MLTFLYDIYVNQNIFIKKTTYFVFIIHQMNKHGVSRTYFTETDVTHFKSGTLKTIKNITMSMVN